MGTKGVAHFLAFATVGFAAATVHADEVDIEVPVLIFDVVTDDEERRDDDLDLANVVQSAAKGVTTVQEAPTIVTVLTGDDIRDRGIRYLEDAIDVVPGWLRVDALHNQFPFGLTRGTVQSMLYMHNGLSLFDPFGNVPSLGRGMPIEVVKRLELITGPGGVLWGAGSYMGIVNVITKDAEDVDGVEASAYVGDGPGDRGVAGGYVMAGIPHVFSSDVSAFLHTSFTTYEGMSIRLPQHIFSTPLPFPNSPTLYSSLVTGSPRRSMFFNFNGKVTIGSVDIAFWLPYAENHTPAGFPGVVTVDAHPEETVDADGDGVLDCSFVEPYLPSGQPNPDAFRSDDRCVDRGRIGGANRIDWLDRYVVATWRPRFAGGAAGATVKGYFSYFDRDFQQLNIMAPSALLEGGASFGFEMPNYRAGISYDGDWELASRLRLLYGAEAMHEWVPDTASDQARHGPGTQSNVISPYDYGRLPLSCPVEPNPDQPGTTQFVAGCPMTMIFATNRTVLAAYTNPQWRPHRRLTLDAGVRLQVAPDALSEADYPLQLIFSGAAVYELAKNWHAKLNYAEGFRPPVFNNTDSNGLSIQLDGSRDLEVENSQAIQGEINARIFKGRRSLREVNFRVDYSYTKLENLIQIIGGRYENTADRGIHSAEFLGKVFLEGGHRVELGYTWLTVATADIGYLKAVPEHWFNLTGVFELISDRLHATTVLQVMGAQEDPNRLVEFRMLDQNPPPGTLPDENSLVSQPHELVLDRLPPSARLSLGLTWLEPLGIDKLAARLFVYNAFNNRHYQPDPFHTYEPRLEFLPNPYPDVNATASLAYAY